MAGEEHVGALAGDAQPAIDSPAWQWAFAAQHPLGVSFALLNYAFDEISNPALRPVRRPHVARKSV